MMSFVAIPVVLGSQAGAVATGWVPPTVLVSVGVAALAPLAWGLIGLVVVILVSRRNGRRTATDSTAPHDDFREAA
jgi:hypothetical protein